MSCEIAASHVIMQVAAQTMYGKSVEKHLGMNLTIIVLLVGIIVEVFIIQAVVQRRTGLFTWLIRCRVDDCLAGEASHDALQLEQEVSHPR